MARDVSVKTSWALSASLFLSPAKAMSGTISRHNLCDSRMVHDFLIVYAPDEKKAHRACRIKAAMLAELGLEVHFCGSVNVG